MSKQFTSAARLHFRQRLALVAPEFHPIKVPVAYSWPSGESAYIWKASASASCFIFLVNSPKGEPGFSIETGWSTLGRFPQIASRPSVPANIRIKPEISATEFISNISSVSSGPAFWKAPSASTLDATDIEQYLKALAPMSAEKAQMLATELVDDAFIYIENEVLPFLRDVVNAA